MFMAYVDKLGVLRAQTLLPEKALGQRKEALKQFVFDHKPDLIVLNSRLVRVRVRVRLRVRV
jgi:hypothetical protein